MSAAPVVSSPAYSQPSLPECNVCKSTEKVSACAKCNIAFYCSKDHQISDWKIHKLTCKPTLWSILKSQEKEWLGASEDVCLPQTKKMSRKDYWGKENAEASSQPPTLLPKFLNDYPLNFPNKLAIDLGCGRGHASLWLLEQGWRVIAVDFSSKSLAILKSDADRINKQWIQSGQLQIVESDIAKFEFPQEATLVYASASLNYVDPKKIKEVWDKIHKSLIAGGAFVAFLLYDWVPKAPAMYQMTRRIQLEMGAWLINDLDAVKQALTQSNYEIFNCYCRTESYIPGNLPAYIDFAAIKK